MNAGPRFDLHVHSRHSPDSSEPLERLVAEAASQGLAGFALTDHNTIDGHDELRDLAIRWPSLVLVPGVEVSTREGHLLLYGLDELPPLRAPVEETVRWAADRGVPAVPAHPFRWSHGIGGSSARRLPLTAIETRNGHNSPWANQAAERLRDERRLAGTGGSDAHRAAELGRCTTTFSRPVRSPSEFVTELSAGRLSPAGEELSASARARLVIGTFARRVARGFRPI